MPLHPLQPGDIVEIIAPASHCSHGELVRGLRQLKQIGLVPRVPKDLFEPSVLFSNSDQRRLADLKKALYSRDSKLIWCVRGGYGSLRLIPQMRRWKKPVRPKILLGYSDITTLHSFLNQEWNWPTWHGPLLDRFGRQTTPALEKKRLVDLLMGRVAGVEFTGLKPLNPAARRSGEIRSVVVGGNMAVLQSGLGTPVQFDPRGKIIFFEDTGERPHRVDRMLTQFTQSGCFAVARAVVLGHFQLSEASDRRQLWQDVIWRFAREQKIPVLAGLPVGHDPKRQSTLPLNTPAVLRLGARPSLSVAAGF